MCYVPAMFHSPLRSVGSSLAVAVIALAPLVTKAAPPAPTPAPNSATPPAPTAKKQLEPLKLPVERVTLANGLKVVLSVDHGAPTAAVCVTYDVGSRNEQPKRSGFAHLFEHMMFQGSRNVEKGQHFMLITDRGGTLNGTTSVDRTNYYELVPSSGLATVLWLEADRMKSLAVNRENFENQRAVVQEEYRMRVSNAAYAMGRIKLRELAFQGYWPHEHDTIGSMQDLDDAQLEWLRAFHQSYYAPNNAVLTITGDFDPKATLELVNEYFGDAKPTDVPAYSPPQLPDQTQPRSAEVRDPNAKTPGVYQGWVIPPSRTAEHYALELATVILSFGDSSVLHEKLVRDEAVLRDIATYTYDHRGPDLLVLQALLTERADLQAVQKRLDEELQLLATKGPTRAQLDKAKQRLQSFWLFGLEGNLDRATKLAEFELFWGDAALLNTELARYLDVTAQQVQQAVSKFLTPARRSTVVVLPESVPAAPAAAASSTQPKSEKAR